MASKSAPDPFHTIGMAVVACQFLEIVFALCVKLVYKQAGAAGLDEIQPLSKGFSKPPTRNLIAELKRYTQVDAQFETALEDIIERRHTLIHRWTLGKGWGEESQQEVSRFAHDLAQDAQGLTRVLVKDLYDFMGRFPGLRTELAAMDENWLQSLPERLKGLRIEGET